MKSLQLPSLEESYTFADYHCSKGQFTEIEQFLKLEFGSLFPKSKLLFYIKKIMKFNEMQALKNNSTPYNFMVLKNVLFVDKKSFKQS